MTVKVVAMSDDAKTFLKTLTNSEGMKKLIDALADTGVEFGTHFYYFTATIKSTVVKVVLPVGTNSLSKHHAANKPLTPEVALAEGKIRAALFEMGTAVFGEKKTNQIVWGASKTPELAAQFFNVGATPDLPGGKEKVKSISDPLIPESVVDAVMKKMTNNLGLKPGFLLDAVEMPYTFPPVAKLTPGKVLDLGLSAPVKLIDAKTPGQRVHGSSPGSIYTCVALSPALKLAARYEEGTVAFRIEGSLSSQVAKVLQQHNFEIKGGYASLHLSCSNSIHARRAIGAVIYGTGLNYTAKLDNLETVFE